MKCVTIGDCSLYLGDCRKLLPTLAPGSVDAVVTDPPYPDTLEHHYQYRPDGIDFLDSIACRQFVFWTPSNPFPLTWSGKRIWDKRVGTCTQFEEIYERNFGSGYIIHRAYSMGCFSSVGAQMTGEQITGHPSQKPIRLILELIEACSDGTVFDPFMGSGTTGVACVRLGRKFIGCEIEPRYFDIACKRIQAEYDKLALFDPPPVARQMEMAI